MKISIPKHYMKALGELGLKADAFPIEAPEKVDYWADLKKLFDRLVELHLHSLLSPSSKIYAYWGPLGSGKTHACRYFSNKETQRKLLKALRKTGPVGKILSISAVSPVPRKTGQLTNSVYKDIVSNLFLEMGEANYKQLLEMTKTAEVPSVSALNRICKIIEQRRLTPSSYFRTIRDTDEYKFLMLMRSKQYGVLETTTDLGLVIESLIKAMLKTHDRIFVWIDELENLKESTLAERRLLSDLVRKIFDGIDYGLTIILIFSCDTFTEVQQLLLPAIQDRIGKDGLVEFPLMKNTDEFIDYFQTNVRVRGEVDPISIIEKSALERIAEDIKQEYGEKGISARNFNREMQELLTSTYLFSMRKEVRPFKITEELLDSLEKQKDISREISKELLGEEE